MTLYELLFWAALPIIFAFIVFMIEMKEDLPFGFFIIGTIFFFCTVFSAAVVYIGLTGRWEDTWILPTTVLIGGGFLLAPRAIDNIRNGECPISYDMACAAMLVIVFATIVAGFAKAVAVYYGS
jgi:hypothetical protein